jgi:uncharacterized protein YdhG (YjbR/CyaY superfamily)
MVPFFIIFIFSLNKPKMKAKTVDEYIAGFPKETQKVMKQIRITIRKNIPGAKEKISYGIPGYFLNDIYVIYFAGYKKHISFYPAPVGVEAFKKAFASYKTGKGTVQLPLDKPMPWSLITRIIKYRLKENLKRTKTIKK